MQCRRLSLQRDAKAFLKSLGVHGGGISILHQKMQLLFIAIDALHVGAANILKQDALSIGADLAVPKGTVTADTATVDTLLIVTLKQLEQLIKKERTQPFGLKKIAEELVTFLPKPYQATKIMGIINANDDSFYASSRFNAASAQRRIEQMIEEGADAIDIGGLSSRPGAQPISAQEELSRVDDIIKLVHANNLYNHAAFSIDSYQPLVVNRACEHGFSIVNDITALSNHEVGAIAAQFDATVVLMHMQGTPLTMQDNPQYENTLFDIETFLLQRIELAKSLGVRSLILDVGIGFGKRLDDNLTLLKQIEHFHHLDYALLVGASRKSMIDQIIATPVEARLPGTLAIACAMQAKGVQWLRVHDVKEHKQALAVHQQLL